MHSRRCARYSWLPVILLLGIWVSACRPSSEILPGSTQMDVTLTTETCAPGAWTVLADHDISISFHNQTDETRQFTVMLIPVTPQPGRLITANILWSTPVPPGESGATFTTPPTAGEYDILCGPEGTLSLETLFRLIVTQPQNQTSQ